VSETTNPNAAITPIAIPLFFMPAQIAERGRLESIEGEDTIGEVDERFAKALLIPVGQF